MMILSERFAQAFLYAFNLHRHQTRKGGSVPYLAHLMGVAALVIENGGSEDEAIAALLHDAPEDQGGKVVLDEIRRSFGNYVAEIVDGCTDTYEKPKLPWRSRKETYLNHLRHASPEVRRVSLADKLHNARSILQDLQGAGDSVWERFNGGKEGTLWYYRALVNVFLETETGRNGLSPMLAEFADIVTRIESQAG
jgi:(p)ppGpp synthase/HD superfamily hydrolase